MTIDAADLQSVLPKWPRPQPCSRRNLILRLRINFYNSVVASLVGGAIASGWRSTRSPADISRLKRDLLCSESHPYPLNPLNPKEKGVSELLLDSSDSESTKSLVLPYSDVHFLEVSNQYVRFRLLSYNCQLVTLAVAAFVHQYILSPFGSDDSQLG
jgi:hypothetical protein